MSRGYWLRSSLKLDAAFDFRRESRTILGALGSVAESRGTHIGRRFWAPIGLAALLGYAAWIGAPYLRSVVVRDAAVTTWIDDVDSPIRGYVDKNPLHAGDRVGADGRIATIENPIEDGTPVAKAEAELERAKQRVRGSSNPWRMRSRTPTSRS